MTKTPLSDAARIHNADLYEGIIGLSNFVPYEFACELELRLQALEKWKKEQIEVESTWDEQAIGRLLDIPLGHPIRSRIQESIELLKQELSQVFGLPHPAKSVMYARR